MVSSYNLVLQYGSIRNVDSISMTRRDDISALENNIVSKEDVARHGQVVEFHDVWDSAEPIEKVVDLAKVSRVQFDKESGAKHPGRATY